MLNVELRNIGIKSYTEKTNSFIKKDEKKKNLDESHELNDFHLNISIENVELLKKNVIDDRNLDEYVC